jgi:hypothetical protein
MDGALTQPRKPLEAKHRIVRRNWWLSPQTPSMMLE